MNRVVVIGPPGSGTRTFSDRLARALGATVVDLGTLFRAPGEEPATTPEFRSRVVDAISSSPRWVVVGNHVQVADLTHRSADTIVWLDLGRRHTVTTVARRALGSALPRTLRRGPATDAGHVAGRERWRDLFHPRHGAIAGAWRAHPRHRATFEELSSTPLWLDTEVHRLRHPADVEAFLAGVGDDA